MKNGTHLIRNDLKEETAIGHPHGASGARLAGTLSRILNEKKKQRGVATLCTAGGQGYAIVLERS